jgi:hypothetical protein
MSRDHTDWCAGGHRCNLGEHRADSLVVEVGDVHLVLTRVRTRSGRQYVEVRGSAELHEIEGYARAQFARFVGRLARALGERQPTR